MTARPSQTPSPRIAVVIPCFNDGRTVAETVRSAHDQEPCEIVLVDDGSDDEETLSVLEELAADGLTIVRQDNRGLPQARMAGVRATAAPYVFPLDADDLVAPGSLAPLADALDRDRTAVLAWGDEETFGRFRSYRRATPHLDPWRITYVNEVPGALIRRDALLDVEGWQLEAGYEDWDLWMAFAERGWKGVYVPGLMLRYRIHDARLLAASIPRHASIYEELERRHPSLFEHRRENRRRSPAPARLKLVLPLVDALPVSAYTKQRLYRLVVQPRQLVRERRARQREDPG